VKTGTRLHLVSGVKNEWSCTFISPFNFMACIPRYLVLYVHSVFVYAIREYDVNKDINAFYLSSLD